MEKSIFDKTEVFAVLEVLSNRIAHLMFLINRYPDSSLCLDWKLEIKVLELFCNKLEEIECIKPVGSDVTFLPICFNNTIDD